MRRRWRVGILDRTTQNRRGPADGSPMPRLPGSRTPTLRVRYLFVAIAALVILQVFATLVSGVSARESLVTAAREGITREGRTTIQTILRHLEPAEQSVEITARLLAADLVDTAAPGLEQYLFTQLAVMPQMTGAFVGYPNGDFVFVSVDGDGYQAKRITTEPQRRVVIDTYDADFVLASQEVIFDDDYDPRARPWFEDAVSTDGLVWTDPYVFFGSGEPGVTASGAVLVDDDVLAVVGVDVELTGLDSFLEDLSVSQDGEAFVVSGDEVIGAPSSYSERTGVTADGDVRLLTTAELDLPPLGGDVASDVRLVETTDGADLVLRSDFPEGQGLDWSVVVRAPESTFTDVSETQERNTLLITLGGSLLVLAGAILLVLVSRPIREVEALATTDSLTGLANRRGIDGRGAEMLSNLKEGRLLSVAVLDLDGFKELNDVHGHHAGDVALREVGNSLMQRFTGADLIGRLGGDEFVLVQDVASLDDAVETANSVMDDLRDTLSATFPDDEVGVTAGMTAGGPAAGDFPSLLLEADTALLSAKSEYKGLLRLADGVLPTTL